SLEFTHTAERLLADHNAARSDPIRLRDFRSQNLNIAPDESTGEGKWMAMARWDAAADRSLTLKSVIEGSLYVYVGVDRGGLDDPTAIAMLGKTKDDVWLVWSQQFISRDGYEKRRSVVDYDAYAATGELIIYNGGGGGDLPGILSVVRECESSSK